ncbi:MAG: hypothetical protein AAAB20_30650 [Rhizobium sp.]|uniref:hypothetical protein n=1 Tax=Rhizobium sp. TaxID=391 RepID=UPI0030F15519
MAEFCDGLQEAQTEASMQLAFFPRNAHRNCSGLAELQGLAHKGAKPKKVDVP